MIFLRQGRILTRGGTFSSISPLPGASVYKIPGPWIQKARFAHAMANAFYKETTSSFLLVLSVVHRASTDWAHVLKHPPPKYEPFTFPNNYCVFRRRKDELIHSSYLRRRAVVGVCFVPPGSIDNRFNREWSHRGRSISISKLTGKNKKS